MAFYKPKDNQNIISVEKKVSILTLNQLQSYISNSSFTNPAARTMERIYTCWLSSGNILLYGQDNQKGITKSDVVYLYLSLLDSRLKDVYSLPMLSKFTAISNEFGIDENITWSTNESRKTSNYVYEFFSENINLRYFVFEDIFDSYIKCYSSIGGRTIQSVLPRQKTTPTPFYTTLRSLLGITDWAICITNKSASMIIEDTPSYNKNSVDAFLQRLPLKFDFNHSD